MSERKERCETCRFWDQEEVEDKFYGVCRRGHPVIARGSVVQDSPGDPVDAFDAFWPHTRKFDWCGEWEAKQPPKPVLPPKPLPPPRTAPPFVPPRSPRPIPRPE